MFVLSTCLYYGVSCIVLFYHAGDCCDKLLPILTVWHIACIVGCLELQQDEYDTS